MPRWFKILTGILAGLLVLYAVIGFWLVPWWLTARLIPQATASLQVSVRLERLAINPFALSVTVETLSITDADGTELARLDEGYVNLAGLRSLFGEGFTLQAVRLEAPDLAPDVDRDGRLNFLKLLPDPGEETKPEADEPTVPPRVRVDVVDVVDGRIAASLHVREDTVFRKEIQSIDFRIEDFDTGPGGLADNSLSFTTPEGEQVTASAQTALEPVRLEGRIEVDGLVPGAYTVLLPRGIGLEVISGKVHGEMAFRVDLAASEPVIRLEEGRLVLEAVRIAPGTRPDAVQHLDNLVLDGIEIGFGEKAITLESLTVSGLRLDLRLDEDGRLHLPGLPDDAEQKMEVPEPVETLVSADAEPGLEWAIRLDRFRLEGAAVSWRQEALPGDEPQVLLGDGTFSADNLAIAASGETPFRGSFRLGGKPLTTEGSWTRSPEADSVWVRTEVDALPVAMFEPWLRAMGPFAVRDGTVGVTAETTVRGIPGLDTASPTLDGSFSLTAANWRLEETETDETVAGLGSFALTGDVSGLPLRLSGLNGSLDQPQAKLLRVAGGDWLLPGAAAGEEQDSTARTPADDQPESPEPAEASAEDPTAFGVNLDNFAITAADLQVVDRSGDSPVVLSLSPLDIDVGPLAYGVPGETRFTLSGKVGDAGGLSGEGRFSSLQPLNGKLNVQVADFSLRPLEAQVERFLGYAMKTGGVSLDLDYAFASPDLDGRNEITLKPFQLGESVDSPDAIQAPVGLALALYRDPDGGVRVKIPISGELNDPSFSLGPAIRKALANLIIKAGTSPFRVLGGLLPSGQQNLDLSFVAFEPGKAVLPAAAGRKIGGLQTALEKRPELRVLADAFADPEIDGPVMQQAQVDAWLNTIRTQTDRASPAEEDAERRLWQAAYERFVIKQPGTEEAPPATGGTEESSASAETDGREKAPPARRARPVTVATVAPESVEKTTPTEADPKPVDREAGKPPGKKRGLFGILFGWLIPKNESDPVDRQVVPEEPDAGHEEPAGVRSPDASTGPSPESAPAKTASAETDATEPGASQPDAPEGEAVSGDAGPTLEMMKADIRQAAAPTDEAFHQLARERQKRIIERLRDGLPENQTGRVRAGKVEVASGKSARVAFRLE
ncbi:MAG: DUF748 domain-containing protein [Opitutales bacterium]